jgi:hypothetical protein
MVSHGPRLDALEHGDAGAGFGSAWREFLDTGRLPAAEGLVQMILVAARSAIALRANGDVQPVLDEATAAARLALLDRCESRDAADRAAARDELQRVAVEEALARRATQPWRYPPPVPTPESHEPRGAAAPAPAPAVNTAPGTFANKEPTDGHPNP